MKDDYKAFIIFLAIGSVILIASCDSSLQNNAAICKENEYSSLGISEQVFVKDSTFSEVFPTPCDCLTILNIFKNYIVDDKIKMHDERALSPVFFDPKNKWVKYKIHDSVEIVSTIHDGEVCEYYIVCKNETPTAILRSYISNLSTKIFKTSNDLILIYQNDKSSFDGITNPNIDISFNSQNRFIFLFLASLKSEFIIDEKYNLYLPGDSVYYVSNSEFVVQNNILKLRVVNEQHNIIDDYCKTDTFFFTIPPVKKQFNGLPPNIKMQKSNLSKIK